MKHVYPGNQRQSKVSIAYGPPHVSITLSFPFIHPPAKLDLRPVCVDEVRGQWLTQKIFPPLMLPNCSLFLCIRLSLKPSGWHSHRRRNCLCTALVPLKQNNSPYRDLPTSSWPPPLSFSVLKLVSPGRCCYVSKHQAFPNAVADPYKKQLHHASCE